MAENNLTDIEIIDELIDNLLDDIPDKSENDTLTNFEQNFLYRAIFIYKSILKGRTNNPYSSVTKDCRIEFAEIFFNKENIGRNLIDEFKGIRFNNEFNKYNQRYISKWFFEEYYPALDMENSPSVTEKEYKLLKETKNVRDYINAWMIDLADVDDID